MLKKAIITGVNGFVGEHVVDTFIEDGFEVVGVGYDVVPGKKVAGKISSYKQCNLLDERSVSELDLSDASVIIHLAGLSSVGESFKKPLAYITDNSVMVYNLLNHAKNSGFSGRAVIVSSGNVYNPRQPLPLTEGSEVFSNSPYAVGKLSSEFVAQYFSNQGLGVVVVRPFNHIGPGQVDGFLIPDLYKQLLSAVQVGYIEVGNLETKRDYTDVRDIVRAYKKLALADNLEYGVYNICSGTSYSGNQILEIIQNVIDNTSVEIRVDSNKIRPSDIMDLYGDSSRLTNELGWTPEIPLQQTIRDFVDYERRTLD